MKKETSPITSSCYNVDHDYAGSIRTGRGRLYHPVVKQISELGKDSKENKPVVLTADDSRKISMAMRVDRLLSL